MSNIILGSDGIAIRQGIYQQSFDAKTDLGRFIPLEDGRIFRYCKCDGGITIGYLCVSPTFDDDDDQVAQTNYGFAVGSKDNISVLLGAAPTANQYADGLLVVSDGDGEGQSYRIRKNTAVIPIKIWLYDEVITAVADGDDITLMKNKYLDVIVSEVAGIATPIGVPLITITDNYYFWAQTRGYVGVLVDGSAAPVVGDNVMAGAAGTVRVAAGAVDPVIGVCVFAAPTGEYCIVDLHLE